MINCTAIMIKTLSDKAYDEFFRFLYENKIPAECHDISQTIVVRGKDFRKIDISEKIVFTSQMSDTLELNINDFYKIEIL